MTDLEKSPVTRRSTCVYKGRRLIVTLRKDDIVEIRLERARGTDSLKIPLLDLIRNPAQWSTLTIPQRRK